MKNFMHEKPSVSITAPSQERNTMSAEVEANKETNVKTINGDNWMTIDFETITQTTSKASIPTGTGINAIAKIARSAADEKKPN